MKFRTVIFLILVAVLIKMGPYCAYAGVVTIYPEADAYVSYYEPATNFGGATTLKTGFNAIIGSYFRSYLRFSLPEIPIGTNITSAMMYLYCNDFTNNADYPIVYVSRITEDTWSEAVITRNNAPFVEYLDGTIADQSISGVGLYGFNLMSHLDTWSAIISEDFIDNNLSMLVYIHEISSDYQYWEASFFSKEAAENRPYIQLTTDAVPLPNALWLLGSGLCGLWGWRRRKGR